MLNGKTQIVILPGRGQAERNGADVLNNHSKAKGGVYKPKMRFSSSSCALQRPCARCNSPVHVAIALRTLQ